MDGKVLGAKKKNSLEIVPSLTRIAEVNILFRTKE
jgi:hypothetical protein